MLTLADLAEQYLAQYEASLVTLEKRAVAWGMLDGNPAKPGVENPVGVKIRVATERNPGFTGGRQVLASRTGGVEFLRASYRIK